MAVVANENCVCIQGWGWGEVGAQTVSINGLLMILQEAGKHVHFALLHDAIQVHGMQDRVGRQLLAPLILEESCQDAGTLLPCRCQDGAVEAAKG